MNLIQTILLAAITSLTNNNASTQTVLSDSNLWDDEGRGSINGLRKRQPFHNVFRLCKSGRLMQIAQHFSHRSHSSHSSHSSHYSASGSYGVGGAPRTSTSVNSTYSTRGTTRDSNMQQRVSSKVGSYKLGDTDLKKGEYGTDVDELIALLSNHGLLENYTVRKKNGFTFFDEELETVVKELQRQFGINADGIVTTAFIAKLRELK